MTCARNIFPKWMRFIRGKMMMMTLTVITVVMMMMMIN